MRPLLAEALGESLRAVRSVLRPFLAIQAAMLATALAYALLPAFRASFVGLAAFRERGGTLFSAAGMLLAGVVVPELSRRLAGLRSEILSLRLLAFYVVYFAGLGLLIAGLQDTMAGFLGPQDARGIALRVLFDQLAFTPFLAMPLAAVVFAWRDADFRAAGVGAAWRSGELARRYVRLLVTCWLFWFPILAGVYAVPLPLQYPLVLIAEAAWALLVLALERRGAHEEAIPT